MSGYCRYVHQRACARYTYEHKFVATIREDITTYTGSRIDFVVDMGDIKQVARAYSSYPGHLRWNPAADIDGNYFVSVIDLACVTKTFGWSCGLGFPLNSQPFEQPYQVYLVVNSSKTVVCSTCNLTLSVYVVNVTKLMAFEVRIGYDSDLLELLGGTVISPFEGDIYEIEGYLAITSMGAPFNGSAHIAELNFTAKAKDEALIDPSESILASGCRVTKIPYTSVTARVNITMLGDVTGDEGWPDGACDILDVATVSRYFGQDSPPAPANYDIIYDGAIDMVDVATVARHFGETDP